MLLHTLSHLLSQSLAMRYGYPANPIRDTRRSGRMELWDQVTFAWLIERVKDNEAQGATSDLACRAEP